jgi:cellulose synthase/poly-beta-1,6-N-acetylglucosamine synthase-like glycosyltransferase
MRLAFWSAAALIVYTYIGYAGWLWLRSRWRPRLIRRASFSPAISIVMVVRNEASVLERKLENLEALNYPGSKPELVVTSDGSTDSTNDILGEFAVAGRVRAVLAAQTQGKAAGLNRAIDAASGEIIVFTDARQKIEPDAVRLLVENFADPEVGCASGELMLGDPNTGEAARGLSLYWRIEKRIREMESASGSVMGATGAIYAVRRSLITPLPSGILLDDVYIPMHVVKQGFRVVFDSRACAWDLPDLGTEREFTRKVRTLSGNYQLFQLAPWLLGFGNPSWFDFVSHKLLRLLIPFALATTFITSALLSEPLYRTAFILQLCFYGLSILALARMAKGPVARIADGAFTFVLLNTAALVAFVNFVTGRKAAWIGGAR